MTNSPELQFGKFALQWDYIYEENLEWGKDWVMFDRAAPEPNLVTDATTYANQVRSRRDERSKQML